MFEFKAELDSPLERKKRFVSIRNEVKETRQGEEEESLFSSYNISTQNIEESSLSDDLNQYDFNSGTAQTQVSVTCEFPPYGPDCPVDRHKFFTTVAFLMCDKSKPVYTATGEVVGMILKYLEVKEQETEGEFHTYIINNISSLQLSKPDNFIYCIHKIHQQYPPTADR
ncbi:hypothetical protein LOTGIDRAFT_174705 [Lottia gigantea]|uniref:DNA-dependent protein kinase catalytic subunit CC5 domain-containing protein n=1 Tax=Lottia gigantea TaxID=225164 RepID=V4APN2_LOTGI|nr:hypothetical protein LOTGIDRAFT_174705 [Lottia gigantea]ESO96750.1 hypothetical protein LOTGIDRAFT_174705 [Lottia gigantea]